jgi:Spy/CpxP family protein refolding chaperone
MVLAVVALLATLGVGIIIGFVASHVLIVHGFPRSPSWSTSFLVHRLDRRLDLTDEQEAQITRIVDQGHGRISGAWADVHPRVHEEIARTNAEIERVLTPEQREKFSKIKMRMAPRRSGRAIRYGVD